MMSTVTITEFLLARIAEDEAAMAGAEGAAAWPLDTMRPQVSGDSQSSWVVIGRDRVLAECEAKRRIVTLAWAYSDGPEAPRTLNLANDVLAQLALPYADHTDFDPAWRVAD